MPRTARPEYTSTTPEARAAMLAKTVRRRGRVSRAELREALSRVVNLDGVASKEVTSATSDAMKRIPTVDKQIKKDGRNLQFFLVRPRK